MSHSESFDRLTRMLAQGRISRREFAVRAVGMGATATSAMTFLAAPRAAPPRKTPHLRRRWSKVPKAAR